MNTILESWKKANLAGKAAMLGCGGIGAFVIFMAFFFGCSSALSISLALPTLTPSSIGQNNPIITTTTFPTSTTQIETPTELADRFGLPVIPISFTDTPKPSPKVPPTATPPPPTATRPPPTATLVPPTLTKTSSPVPPSTATNPPNPPTPAGANVSCSQIGNAQICAWVSNPSPSQYSNVTVYGRLLVDGAPQANQTMNATWYYKTTTSACGGLTGGNGIASCSRGIGRATIGYTVRIAVTINGNTATTSFTP